MAVGSTWPVRMIPLGSVASGAILWRARGQLSLTMVVKATFQLVHGGEMTLVEPDEIVRDDAHEGGDPARGVRASSDLALYLGRADVTLSGHACAPRGRPAPVQRVRLAVLREGALVDRALLVYGDRREGVPQPFDTLPIGYERAFGGPGSPQNPAGVGLRGGARIEPPIHSVADPADPYGTAGFGPIARAWPERSRRLARVSPDVFGAEVAEIPSDFDFGYFQSAPPEQRCDFLSGDETIVLEWLHPDVPRFETRLPREKATARIYGLSTRPRVVSLLADTLRIDADAWRCSVTWRRSVFPSSTTRGGSG